MAFKFQSYIGLLLLTWSTICVQAQVSGDLKPASDIYILKNCFVVPQPGKILSGQDILIKNGKIADIGSQLKKPFDALEIRLDSMYVYAGFIDAYSNTGIARPEEKERPKVTNTVYPQNEEAGITPQVRAKDSYKSTDKSVPEMRTAGFTLSNVIPRGLMLPGSSDVFILGDKPGDRMLFKAGIGQNFQFAPIRGIYPGTVMGVMAKFRELYKNAEIYGKKESLYQTLPSQYNRPEYSRELEAIYEVTTRKTPLFIKANHAKDIHRAMKLRSELGFNLILADVQQGWYNIDEIKKHNIPVLLSLELPAAPKEDVKKDSTKVADKSDFELKKEQSIQEYLSQASAFEKAGIPFGFSCLSVKATDIKKNIQTMITHGLSESTALAALTTYPAQLLGISKEAGTVEKGKLANLVITDKPYFDEKSKIRYVFVEGSKYEYADRPQAKNSGKSNGEDPKYVGIWSYIVDIQGMSQEGKVNITFADDQYKISMFDNTRPYDEIFADNVRLDGQTLTFTSSVDMGQPVTLQFELNMDDKNYSGTISVGAFGSFPIKGTWLSKPNNF